MKSSFLINGIEKTVGKDVFEYGDIDNLHLLDYDDYVFLVKQFAKKGRVIEYLPRNTNKMSIGWQVFSHPTDVWFNFLNYYYRVVPEYCQKTETELTEIDEYTSDVKDRFQTTFGLIDTLVKKNTSIKTELNNANYALGSTNAVLQMMDSNLKYCYKKLFGGEYETN